jgi:DNA-binding NarL/FixJ family response regulator
MCIKVLLADDTAFMRSAIRNLLGREPEIELVGEAQNFAESLSLTRKFRPHVVILDLHSAGQFEFDADERERRVARLPSCDTGNFCVER